MKARSVAARVGVFALVVLLVAGLSVLPGILLAPSAGPSGQAPKHPAWTSSRLDPQRLAANGTASPDGDVGTVLFDTAHQNRFEREAISPLVTAIVRAGGNVRFTRSTTDDFSTALEGVDVLVVIDPAVEYTADQIEAVASFVQDGGRLVMFGEPNRKAITVSGFAASVATRRSKLDGLASEFGIAFGTSYLYDMRNKDGGFKNVLTGPRGTDAPLVDGVDRVALYTAAPVTVNRGQVLLRTARTASTDGLSTTRRFPVAVVTRGGNVLAVGDTTFMSKDTAAVADNEVFIERIVEFMAEAG